MNKISACLVIHNEDKVLERCLKSLKGVIDEIILVHDGLCRDKSLDIARKFKARIYERKFIGEAEYHRPFAFTKARGEWILHLDADEYLDAELKKNIPKLLNSSACDAYSFSWPYPDKNGFIKKGPFSKTFKMALFRKKNCFMIGISHEYPRSYGKLCQLNTLRIDHHPLYDNFTLALFRTKWKNWAMLQAGQFAKLDTLPVFNLPDKKNHPVYKQLVSIFTHPFFTGITESVKFLLIFIRRGLLTAGVRSWKIAFFELMYIWFVRFYIIKNKYGKLLQ